MFIQVPDGKSECDFLVWRAIFSDGELDVKIPTHDDLGTMFLNCKKLSPNVDEYLINATIRLIRDRKSVECIIDKYFREENEQVKKEVKKFLCTLKWIGLQEDVNYPPPKNLGSKYTLAVYALLEAGFKLSDLRRVLRFGLK